MATGGSDQGEFVTWTENWSEQRDEVTALEAIYEERVVILQSPDDDAQGQFQLQVMVPVHVGEDGIVVDVFARCQSDDGDVPQMAAAAPPGKRPEFQRTMSGRQWHASLRVSHLVPMQLCVTFPHSYPSDAAPLLTLSCLWLDAAGLSAVCRQLDELWNEQPGMPIVFIWVDWLQNSTLQHLHLEKSIKLNPYNTDDMESLDSRDPRALPECSDVEAAVISILRYDQQMEWQEFVNGIHDCHVCFDSKPGSEFFRLPECSHHFCCDCLSDYCNMHVNEGTTQHISCPDRECKLGIPPVILQQLLKDEAYQRWEKFQLQKALDTMGDVVWCPRCHSPVVQEPEEDTAHCLCCIFTFCLHCEDPWEPTHHCKTLEDHLASLSSEAREDVLEHLNATASGCVEKKLPKLDPKARDVLRKAATSFLSRSYIKKISKPCPRCRVPIEKSSGCNKVTCSQCGGSMCWLCGKKINGYEHFQSSGCGLFPGQMDVWMPYVPAHLQNREHHAGQRRVLDAILQGNPNIIGCPRCRQRCMKEGRNNHIRCWQCKSHFCFQCRFVITGPVTEHFRPPAPCQQHSE